VRKMVFEEVEIKDEVELENTVKEHITAIEKGMIYLDSQRTVEGGRLDILAVDSGKRFVIMELKVREDDYMLLQALDYLDYVIKNKDRLANFYSKQKSIEIDKDSPPRIVLIAPSFSDKLRKATRYIDETYPVELFTFRYLKIVDIGRCAPLFSRVETLPREEYEEPTTIEDHVNYITDPEAREACMYIKNKIESLGNVTCVPRAYWLTFFFKGRRFATILTRRNFFYVYACELHKGWDEWPYAKITKKEDFTGEFFEKIREQYTLRGRSD
jgi:hypothetical protein